MEKIKYEKPCLEDSFNVSVFAAECSPGASATNRCVTGTSASTPLSSCGIGLSNYACNEGGNGGSCSAGGTAS